MEYGVIMDGSSFSRLGKLWEMVYNWKILQIMDDGLSLEMVHNGSTWGYPQSSISKWDLPL